MVEVTPGEGEIIGDSVDRRVELLAELDAVHATISRFGPGRDGADRHVHRAHADVFVVLDGELTLKDEAGERTAGAGSVLAVPAMVIHGFANRSADDVWYLNLHAPGRGFGDYLRGLREGVRVDFDQFEPPADGQDVRPASEIVIADRRATVDGLDIVLGDDGVLAVGDLLRIVTAVAPTRR